ncbi:DNA-binding response OmpR family regulator [Melghiribacillus thermohalophilus]|uniref:DNA-binding response OmpR family regulator n=1 Tax=Melghiribacillus thermohalophilus TaxID=1324956 RepID=A0A4R3MPR6_9BACI|nr:response regulator transcription factor [Melghiribacillus thermohalophilus]TCT17535.1 DNA-binding response OmpR family regulator [Melghiribacillus thermohalophilus]
MKEHTILIVEDEKEIGELVKDYLERAGYQVVLAFDGKEGLHLFYEKKPTLVVLDIMLPEIDGIEVCRMIRTASSIPIIMMTAKKSETDKIIGLGIGADDYVTKPFSPGELVARIKAQLRRYIHFSAPAENQNQTLKFGQLEIDLKGYNVYVHGKPIHLSAKEFQLLHFLATHPGQVFSKEQLFNQIWGFDSYGDLNTVTVYIRKIREKIEPDPSNPTFIKTVWGIGYKFEGSSS